MSNKTFHFRKNLQLYFVSFWTVRILRKRIEFAHVLAKSSPHYYDCTHAAYKTPLVLFSSSHLVSRLRKQIQGIKYSFFFYYSIDILYYIDNKQVRQYTLPPVQSFFLAPGEVCSKSDSGMTRLMAIESGKSLQP